MGIVYYIKCLETNEIYIGSTKQTLKDRMKGHRSDSKDTIAKCLTSSNIIKRDTYIYDVLEEVEDNDKLFEREQYYIDTTDCINIYNSFTSDEVKKKQNIIRVNRFHQKNPDYRKKKTTCECGAIVIKDSIARHRRSKKHLLSIHNRK